MTSIVFCSLWVLSILCIFFQNKIFKCGKYSINGKLICLISISLSLFIVSGFRSVDVGNDTWNYATNVFQYVTCYNDILELVNDEEQTGKGYWAIFYFISAISKSPQMYILGESFLIVLWTSIYIYRTTKNVSLSFLIFLCCFFVTSMSAARQYTGIVIAANGMIFLCNNLKSLAGWVLILISISIHAVNAIVFLGILGIFLSRRITSAYKLFTISCGTMIAIALLVDVILPLILEVIFSNYIGYLNLAWDQNVLENREGMGIGILVLHLLFLLFTLLYCKKAKPRDCGTLEYAMLPSISIAAVAGMLFYSNAVMPRCFYIFDYMMISFLAACLSKFQGIKYYALFVLLIISVSVGYFRVFLVNDYIYSFC